MFSAVYKRPHVNQKFDCDRASDRGSVKFKGVLVS